MRLILKWWYQMVGDCGRRGCGHSIAYHLPFSGCIKCDCEEYV